MEDDRAQTNLGPAAEQGVPDEGPAAPAPKQPRRRFVGRKTAAAGGGADADADADANANIEDS
jgi:2-(3-amino-3-carboxypropyl)histidine synthase